MRTTPEADLLDVANERANNGDVPIDALLAALRRAAEQDGVEDVDGVVAEFATFVRAQAPQLASRRAGHRSGGTLTAAALSAGMLVTAAFGAVATGLVDNPFLRNAPDGGVVSAAETPSVEQRTGDPATGDGATPAATFDPTPVPSRDPDALAGIAQQREQADAARLAETLDGATSAAEPVDHADPVDLGAPSDATPAPNPAATDTGTAADTNPTAVEPDTTTPTSTTSTTTTVPAADGGGSSGESGGAGGAGGSGGVVSAPQLAPTDDTPADSRETDQGLDQGGAG